VKDVLMRIECSNGWEVTLLQRLAVLFMGRALYDSSKSEFVNGFVGYAALDATQLLLVSWIQKG
jgi:hypothetical protein